MTRPLDLPEGELLDLIGLALQNEVFSTGFLQGLQTMIDSHFGNGATNRDFTVPTLTDWDRLRSTTEEDLLCSAADDPDIAPLPTSEEMKLCKPVPARIKR